VKQRVKKRNGCSGAEEVQRNNTELTPQQKRQFISRAAKKSRCHTNELSGRIRRGKSKRGKTSAARKEHGSAEAGPNLSTSDHFLAGSMHIFEGRTPTEKRKEV